MMASGKGNVKRSLESFAGVCERDCLMVNVGKNKLMIVGKKTDFICKVQVDDEKLGVLLEKRKVWKGW